MGIENADELKPDEETTPWPNQKPVVEGLKPDEETDQSPDLYKDDDDEVLDREMES